VAPENRGLNANRIRVDLSYSGALTGQDVLAVWGA
jgi:hypothetical protein